MNADTKLFISKVIKQFNLWAPIVIALCALVVAIDQGEKSRKHNSLSIRPYIAVEFEYTVNGGAGWKLSNYGLGPAILKSFEVDIDGISHSNWESVIQALGVVGVGENIPGVEFRVIRPGLVLEASEKKKILFVEPGEFSSVLFKNNERVKIRACYCSLYDECWETERWNDEPTRVGACKIGNAKFGLPRL